MPLILFGTENGNTRAEKHSLHLQHLCGCPLLANNSFLSKWYIFTSGRDIFGRQFSELEVVRISKRDFLCVCMCVVLGIELRALCMKASAAPLNYILAPESLPFPPPLQSLTFLMNQIIDCCLLFPLAQPASLITSITFNLVADLGD